MYQLLPKVSKTIAIAQLGKLRVLGHIGVLTSCSQSFAVSQSSSIGSSRITLQPRCPILFPKDLLVDGPHLTLRVYQYLGESLTRLSFLEQLLQTSTQVLRASSHTARLSSFHLTLIYILEFKTTHCNKWPPNIHRVDPSKYPVNGEGLKRSNTLDPMGKRPTMLVCSEIGAHSTSSYLRT